MNKNILLLLCFLLPFNSQAENKIVTIAITESPPFEFIENGKTAGINHDTISEVLNTAGYKAKFIPLPFKRALVLVESGEIDAIASIKKSPERNAQFIFSEPIFSSQDYFFKRSDFNISPKSLEDLKTYRIGIVSEYFYGNEINKENFQNLDPITSNAPELDNLEKLAANRLDLTLCSVHVCNYWIHKYPKLFKIDYITPPILTTQYTLHLAFSKANLARSEEITKQFNQELAKYIASGGIKKNTHKYATNTNF